MESLGQCLNCDAQISGKFCSQCGQKSSTSRFTFRKFLEHDLVHGIFHLDRGILYTMRRLLFHSGSTAKNFIKGKRVGHYSIAALFIIIIGMKVLIESYAGRDFVFISPENADADRTANRLFDNYYKILFFLTIPGLSVFTFFLFRRLKYNYVEHLVANCFIVTGALFYSLVLSLIGFFLYKDYILFLSYAVSVFYYIGSLYQLVRDHYSILNFLTRTIVLILLSLIVLAIVVRIFVNTIYGGRFNGKITFEKYDKRIR